MSKPMLQTIALHWSQDQCRLACKHFEKTIILCTRLLSKTVQNFFPDSNHTNPLHCLLLELFWPMWQVMLQLWMYASSQESASGTLYLYWNLCLCLYLHLSHLVFVFVITTPRHLCGIFHMNGGAGAHTLYLYLYLYLSSQHQDNCGIFRMNGGAGAHTSTHLCILNHPPLLPSPHLLLLLFW